MKKETFILAAILLIGNGLFFWMANMIDGQLGLFCLANIMLGFILAKTTMNNYFNFK